MLPDYISKAVPNPVKNRAPWYKNTAPSYAGIFLWIAFYAKLGEGTLDRAGLGLVIAAVIVAGLLSYGLFYYAPAMLGMRTGYPLYVVGSSTFGTKGGYVMPGLLMGLLQIGWFAVGAYFAADFILKGFHVNAGPGSLPFIIVGALWGYGMGYLGVMGIQYVARIATFLNFIPAVMILIVLFKVQGGVANYTPANPAPFIGFTLLVQSIVGFFATAGAAGADFGMNSRDGSDVRKGGLVGIVLAVIFAAGLPLISVAGAHGIFPNLANFEYPTVVSALGGGLASVMFLLFAIASIPPACFCALIAGNSFSTMIPGVPRVSSTMAGVTVAIILAVTGVAANLAGFFTIVGASFGPICGAMAADYLLAGKKWAGPRPGINWAGYGAWALGFLVGTLPFMPIPAEMKTYVQPAVVYSFIVGFVVYIALAKAGLEPAPVRMPETEPPPVRRARA